MAEQGAILAHAPVARAAAPRQRQHGTRAHLPATAGPPDLANHLSLVMHELRAPLAAMAAAAELIEEDYATLDGPRLQAMARSIRRNARWLELLVNNLLFANSPSAGHFQVQPRAADLGEAIDAAVLLIEPVVIKQGQRLRVTVPETLPAVAFDREAIAQVLLNLLSNASKYSGAGATIELSAERRGDWLRVAVEDDGPGIGAEGAEQLFQPYYRAATAACSSGIGLGLTVVRAIVAQHGGRVGAEDRAGGGACFWFELPLVAERPPLTLVSAPEVGQAV